MLELDFFLTPLKVALGSKNMIETKKRPMAIFYTLPRDRSHLRNLGRARNFSKFSKWSKHSHVIYRWKRNLILIKKITTLKAKNVIERIPSTFPTAEKR